MARRQSKARAEDRQNAHEDEDRTAEEILHATDAHNDENAYTAATAISIEEIRPYFDGRTLRRTLRSKGFDDSTVLDMPDPCEVIVLLALHPHEVDVLESAAEDALQHSKTDVKWRSVRINNLFL